MPTNSISSLPKVRCLSLKSVDLRRRTSSVSALALRCVPESPLTSYSFANRSSRMLSGLSSLNRFVNSLSSGSRTSAASSIHTAILFEVDLLLSTLMRVVSKQIICIRSPERYFIIPGYIRCPVDKDFIKGLFLILSRNIVMLIRSLHLRSIFTSICSVLFNCPSANSSSS